ncbi:hypothetical protein PG994_006259 [Apiospora phragmitis]|uniref:EF-hand domain-containing protein n=1 Tax=Apiospora phragmitis TaxID=2905665 RepID=A0ABR1VEI6_9PEZI
MNNYASTAMNDHRHSERSGTHALSHRPSVASASTSRMPGGRFVPPVQNPQQAEPYDQISDEHRSEINDCTNNSTSSEFRYALQALGFSSLPRAELISSFKEYAVPRPNWKPLPQLPTHPAPAQTPGVVDLRLPREGFQMIAAAYIASRDPREELLKTFDLFDKGSKGIITVDDLRLVVKELGEDVPENELRSMIEQFDIEDKGGVGREEFLGIFSSG